MTSAQVVLHRSSLPDASRVQEQFAQAGFQVGPVVGISFSIAGAVALFERFFGIQAKSGDRPFPGDLPLSFLDANLRAHVQSVLFTQPPDFGPGNP